MMNEGHQGEPKTLRVEGRGGLIGGQVVFVYPPETETQVQFRVSTNSGELQNSMLYKNRLWDGGWANESRCTPSN